MEIEIKMNATGELYLEDGGGQVIRLYRFREALSLAGITATTYYTWVRNGLIPDVRLRDKGRWRMFTEAELRALVLLSRSRPHGPHGWPPPPKDAYNWRESL